MSIPLQVLTSCNYTLELLRLLADCVKQYCVRKLFRQSLIHTGYACKSIEIDRLELRTYLCQLFLNTLLPSLDMARKVNALPQIGDQVQCDNQIARMDFIKVAVDERQQLIDSQMHQSSLSERRSLNRNILSCEPCFAGSLQLAHCFQRNLAGSRLIQLF